ncbi:MULTISPECIES: xylulokinase [Staphylococcus]|jgi:xylulokinase|uniref:Xylulose kinase n=1 Tax=Staphylococcus nepalensis TaxID=214473 RepID=A0A2T4S7T3_9STAP|nr:MULTISPECIES: xylulokinase [Staphylococcus]VDG66146.1 xylulose kinase [Lacrimispora indolis]MBO1205537.1 xylulokinase [Staphylococcus nepalensis]MCY1037645.1 xylulokinase [Staphylococcus nepalensis]MDW8552483.1 xylulokinase [Staphylococcus nepalensis]PNZ98402.1 xylulokinase [Staphylococcus nepalensis]
MENVVLGIDLGTSSVKIIAANKQGHIIDQSSVPLTLIQPYPGYNEQDPEDWVIAVKEGIKILINRETMNDKQISGLSFSGQMHGLVPLDHAYQPIRNAILWNDTRTSKQCEEIKSKFGNTLLKNPILEGFTLPKLLWLKQNEPKHWRQLKVFLLPKDYVRYKLTGNISMEYSDAAGTLLLNPNTNDWDRAVGNQLGLGDIYPPLVQSHSYVGHITEDIKKELNLTEDIAVFAGGADNACGALGSGVIDEGQTLCSIGTSGVILSCTQSNEDDYGYNIHFFKHAMPNMSYAMGVTLSAGHSLNWLKETFFKQKSFDEILNLATKSAIGANGLLFAPYLQGERTPHGDAYIRGSFIGINSNTSEEDFSRATIEGITYSLYESIVYMRARGRQIDEIISIGGGAKNSFWLQMQADIFNAKVTALKYEEGPSMGAAMLAAYGLGWFESMEDCTDTFIEIGTSYKPNLDNHKLYNQYFEIYRKIYKQTKEITQNLLNIN